MAYYVSSRKRFFNEVENAVKKHFGDNAEVTKEKYALTVKVKSGYPRHEDRLPDDAPSDMMGGGLVEEIDGCTFIIGIAQEDS